MHDGEVGIEITPILAAGSVEPEFAAQLDAPNRSSPLSSTRFCAAPAISPAR
jgi:hypothetical protein